MNNSKLQYAAILAGHHDGRCHLNYECEPECKDCKREKEKVRMIHNRPSQRFWRAIWKLAGLVEMLAEDAGTAARNRKWAGFRKLWDKSLRQELKKGTRHGLV
jgi:hypothetical protein